MDYLRPVTGATLAFALVAFAWVVIAGEMFGDVDDSLRVESSQGVISAIIFGIGLQVAGASFFATGAFARLTGSHQMCPIPTSYSVAHWLYASALVAAIVVVVIAGKRYFIPTTANRYLTKAVMTP